MAVDVYPPDDEMCLELCVSGLFMSTWIVVGYLEGDFDGVLYAG